MFKKITSLLCATVLATCAVATSAFAAVTNNTVPEVAQAPTDKKYTVSSNGSKLTYIAIKIPDAAEQYTNSTDISFKVTKGVFKSATIQCVSGNLGSEDDIGDYVAPSYDQNISELDSDYDELLLTLYAGTGLKTSDGTICIVRLVYTGEPVDAEFIPYKLNWVNTDSNGTSNNTNVEMTYEAPTYKYTLTGASTTITKTEITSGGSEEPGDDTTPIIGGNADREAAEAFTDYADATAVGKYEGVTSDDQATAFWAELKNGTATGEQATTGNIVWKVTSNGTSKYFKKSVGNAIAGGGSAKVGLIVQNLYDENATAGIAFLQ